MSLDYTNINNSWTLIVNKVKELDSAGTQKVDAFLPQLKPQAISSDFLMLTTSNSFIKFWVESHILDLIKQSLKILTGNDFNIQIEIDHTINTNINQNQESFIAANLVEENNKTNTDPSIVFNDNFSEEINNNENSNNNSQLNFNNNITNFLTFENFVIGNSNNIAYQMSRAVAENPGKQNLNPLFIYGRSGVGKTHLLHAIKNYIISKNPSYNVIYIDAPAFVNEYTAASASHDIDKTSFINFNKKYENAHVLLIDDLQLLQDKTQTLNTFFSLFNNITNQGRQIVISADRAPRNIDVDERYQSRFNNGMSCEITSPEIEVKLGIIKTYIDESKKDEPLIENYINDDVKNYIAQNSSSNIRELKSSITKIMYEIKFSNKELSMDKIREILHVHFNQNNKKKINIKSIQKVCEEYYGISHGAMIGKKKDRNIAIARQVAMFLCDKLLDETVSSIGREFNRDHSTVIHAIRVIEGRIQQNIEVSGEIEILEKKLFDHN